MMRRWSDNLHMRGQSQDRDGKSGIESVVRISIEINEFSGKISAPPTVKKHQSPQKSESPKTGREEKTRQRSTFRSRGSLLFPVLSVICVGAPV